MKKVTKEVKEFCKKFNITENQYFGIDKIEGNLDLPNFNGTLPDSLTVGGYLDLRSFNGTLPDSLTVGGCLYLPNFNGTLPDSLTVGGDLYLPNFNGTLPDSLTVGGDLDLRSFNGTLPDSLTVGGCLDLPNFNGTLPDSLTVGGYLDLRSFNGTLPDSLTVGGYLDLRSFNGTLPDSLTVGGCLYLPNFNGTLPDSLTVGGYLDLRSFNGTLPDSLTVGGDLYLPNFNGTLPDSLTVGGYLDLPNQSKYIGSNVQHLNFIKWKGTNYAKIDGIFCKLIYNKKNIYKAKKINSNHVFYIVSDGNENYSHGDSIKEAKEDLIFKIGNRSKDDYKDLTLKSKLTFEESIKCYRIITGACQFGIKSFLERKNIVKSKKLSIAQIIELTQSEYGNQKFSQFFKA
jgi:hypothetical protein